MKTADEIRRERLAELVREAGSQVAVADRLGKNKNQVYQWLLPSERDGARDIGHDMAREIETAFKKPRGWLDNDPELVSDPNESSRNVHGGQSYAARLDAAILAQAVGVVEADEAVNGPYPPLTQAELLLELYAKIEAGERPMELVAKLTVQRQGGAHETRLSTVPKGN